MKLCKLLVLLLAALVLCESLVSADGADDEQVVTRVKTRKLDTQPTFNGNTRVERTVRVKETEPQVPEVVEDNSVQPAPQQVEVSNVGPINQVNVKPSISISNPAGDTSNFEIPQLPQDVKSDKVSMVPYIIRNFIPKPNERENEDENKKANTKRREEELQIVPYSGQPHAKLEQDLQDLPMVKWKNNGDNRAVNLAENTGNLELSELVNSRNQVQQFGQGNNNVIHKVLANSGNTETVHIDGVGNHKSTRISNVGNRDETQLTEFANNNNNNNNNNNSDTVVSPVLGQVTQEQATPIDFPSLTKQQTPFIQIVVNGADRFTGPSGEFIQHLPAAPTAFWSRPFADGSKWLHSRPLQDVSPQLFRQASSPPMNTFVPSNNWQQVPYSMPMPMPVSMPTPMQIPEPIPMPIPIPMQYAWNSWFPMQIPQLAAFHPWPAMHNHDLRKLRHEKQLYEEVRKLLEQNDRRKPIELQIKPAVQMASLPEPRTTQAIIVEPADTEAEASEEEHEVK